MTERMLYMSVNGSFLKGAGGALEEQPSLLPLRIHNEHPCAHLGRDIASRCEVYNGRSYYCKSDDGHRRVRATEWICTHVARHLGIAVADCAVIERVSGETLFGSLENPSTADLSRMRSYLSRRNTNELGQLDYPGWFLYALHALDLLFNNRDRYPSNFVLVPGGNTPRLSAIDFASASLRDLSTDHFPAATDTTLRLGKDLRNLHGGHIAAAFEIVDRVTSIPMDVIDAILQNVPEAWLSANEKKVIRGDWSGLKDGVRLPALRAGLNDGSLS